MAPIDYSPETQITGILTIICMVYVFLIGSLVLYTAIKKKEKILYYLFFTVVLVFSMWYIPTIAYIYWLFSGEDLPYFMHILGYNMLYPFGILCWLYIYTTTTNIKRKNLILGVPIVMTVILELYMFSFLFIAPITQAQKNILLGEVSEIFVANAGLLIVFGLMFIIIGVGAGIHFARLAIKTAKEDEILWKGRLIYIGFISFLVQILLDAFARPDAIGLTFVIIDRTLLIITGTVWYIGFIMPNWAKKILKIDK